MNIRALIHELFIIFNPFWDESDEKPSSEECAGELRRRLQDIRKYSLDYPIDGCEADIVTPTLSTIQRVSFAILEHHVTIAQLEPEIRHFERIMEWLRGELRSGRLPSDHPMTQDALKRGSALIEFIMPRHMERSPS